MAWIGREVASDPKWKSNIMPFSGFQSEAIATQINIMDLVACVLRENDIEVVLGPQKWGRLGGPYLKFA